MADKKYLDGDGVAQVWQATKDYVATHADARHSAAAESLLGTPDTAQWATRVTAGSGAATVRNVQGAAIGYNQYQVDSYTVSAYGLTATVNNGLLTVTGTPNATITASFALMTGMGLQIPSGHKLLLYNTNSTLMMYVQGLSGYANYGHRFLTANDNTYGKLAISIPITEGQPVNISAHIMLFDLTAMFGSGNEPTTVAEFETMYPAAYYPYSAPTLKPVQIAGIASTDAQGGELDAIEWTAQTLRAAGTIRDELTADELVTRVGGVDMGTLPWRKYSSSGDVGYYFAADIVDIAQGVAYLQPSNLECARYTVVAANWETNIGDKQISKGIGATNVVMVKDSAYTEAADFKAAMAGVLLYYELATPTTTPISPALPMTYKVQQGGSESIIVPDGEVSAAPILTVAEGESAAELVMDALACIAAPDGPTATANHAINTSLTTGGKLYKVTTAIAAGETIVAGTNVTQTTVMDELIALTA